MITAIEGILTRLDVDSVDISIGGVTLKTYVPQSAIDSLGHLGDKVKLFTSLQFRSREDTLTLFGFPSEEHRLNFESLTTVGGVGPRMALNILSTLGVNSLATAVANGDTSAFKPIPGVGTKIANRIILELRGKIEIKDTFDVNLQSNQEVLDALVSLGYTTTEALHAISFLKEKDSVSLEEKIRICLQQMSSG